MVLNNVLKELPEKYKKIQFDIWQCTSKKDIWESFLIKTLSELEYEKEKKSERRMPRLPEARKDVVSCDKLRGTANRF